MNETLLSGSELEAVRRKFALTVQRRDAIKLIRIFGSTRKDARDMIEGPDATFKPLPKRRPTDWNRWSREVIIKELNVPIYA